ncbi:hypothetical protein [Sinorhizobium medicae]
MRSLKRPSLLRQASGLLHFHGKRIRFIAIVAGFPDDVTGLLN